MMTRKQIKELAEEHVRDALASRADSWPEYENNEVTRSPEEVMAVAEAIWAFAPKKKKAKK